MRTETYWKNAAAKTRRMLICSETTATTDTTCWCVLVSQGSGMQFTSGSRKHESYIK